MRAHVLLVDDEEGPREALKFALERKNKWWTISTARSVEEARRAIESPAGEPVDVVLTDLVMGRDHPEGGIEVLDIAKRKDPFIMVILFTAQDKRIDLEETYKGGAFACLEKNILGSVASKEISTKANAAIHFRNMLLSRLEHQKQFTTLRRFFDPRSLRAIIDRPSFLDLKLRPATVLFWDVRGFSGLCAALESHPDLIRGFLTEYYKAATAVIFRHNGILDKFMGDTVMALFCGFGPVGGDFAARSAADAAAAALMLRKVSAEFLDRWRKQWAAHVAEEMPIDLACGMHTDRCLIGELGIEIHGQFTAVGPAVSFASQLQQISQPGQILLSQATADKLREGYAVESLGIVSGLKNVAGEHEVYQLTGKKT